MDIIPVLSYKQIRKINVDTSHQDLKLGTGVFTISFEISPYLRPLTTSEVATILYDTDEGNGEFIDISSINDQIDYANGGWYADPNAFYPIFTYNQVLLYDHFNPSKDYFYNTHCCYITGRKLHWLINDMSDAPLMHMSVDLPSFVNKSPINVTLSRVGKRFYMHYASMGEGVNAQYSDHIYFDYATTESDEVIDLDIFDTDTLTIGYAKRVPTYAYDSKTYTNSLAANLENFRIFKNEALNRFNHIYADDGSSYYSHYRQFHENITQNSKYVLNGKTYHNRDMNKVSVNWLYDEREGTEYQINYIGDLDVAMNEGYLETTGANVHNDLIRETGGSEHFLKTKTSTVYPIISFDVEKETGKDTFEFWQDKMVIVGSYNDATSDYTAVDINIDTIDVSDINLIQSVYDIFRGYITGGIDEENVEGSIYGNNYLGYLNCINDKIIEYNTNGVVVRNIRISSKNDPQYSFVPKIFYNIKPKEDRIWLPELTYHSVSFLSHTTAELSGFNITADEENQNFTYYAEQLPIQPQYDRFDHAITTTEQGIALHKGRILKFITTKPNTSFTKNSIRGDHANNQKFVVFAESMAQYNQYFGGSEFYYNWDDAQSRMSSVDIPAHPIGELDRYWNGANVGSHLEYPDGSYFTVETADGTALLVIEVIEEVEVYDIIRQSLDAEFLLTTPLFIFIHLFNNSRFFVEEVNRNVAKPTVFANVKLTPDGIVSESGNELVKAELANDLSYATVSFDERRTNNTNKNFIIVTYYATSPNKLYYKPIIDSEVLHPLITIWNDYIPRNTDERIFLENNQHYYKIRRLTLIDFTRINSINATDEQDLQSAPNPNVSDADGTIDNVVTKYEIIKHNDTWYIK